MPSFEPGEGAFLKPEYLPILVVGRYEDFYAIQHEVYPGEIFTNNDGVFYGNTNVEVVSDGDALIMIEYSVRVEQLATKNDFDALCDMAQTAQRGKNGNDTH
ncbi:hypothetical protein [Hyphomicrobium sp. 802]|uniref:hypothetical protein n=1 Tax=Hyphomicrobium sp. 802 TaxID=1112272 RepID=UPI0004B2A668|nr:hypothetical protein [Hyphomicrobium sp. 802]